PPQGGRKHPHQELIQINTTNILFICGGAFDGLERIVEKRLGSGGIGFNSEVVEKNTRGIDELFRQVMPQDLVKFGLIPEFIGRVPVTVSLDLLDEDSLVRILTEPKNALTKLYQSLFEIDGVKLEFTEEAIHEIAHLAVERKTGARGLRSIMEDVMMDMMYEIPSDDSIGICTVTKEAVQKTGAPIITRRDTAVGKKTAGHRLPGGSGETA
ncbi:MAG: AAA family ATPase, partial [Stomatobaculum sp.]|nr:AAA family ATPase [Stomatobaculum sp.]